MRVQFTHRNDLIYNYEVPDYLPEGLTKPCNLIYDCDVPDYLTEGLTGSYNVVLHGEGEKFKELFDWYNKRYNYLHTNKPGSLVYIAPAVNYVPPILTKDQTEERETLQRAQVELEEASFVLRPIEDKLNALLRKHQHVWGKVNDYDGAQCIVCDKFASEWFCPDSPDHLCHYNRTEEECDYCRQPWDRQ